jgi:DNA modification methylase
MKKTKFIDEKIAIAYVPIETLKAATYNPRKISEGALHQLTESIRRFGIADPIIANSAPSRKNIVIGGHMRLRAAKAIGLTEIPIVFVNLPDIKKEQELNLRLNRNTGEWDFEKLKSFDPGILLGVGFDDADLSTIWDQALEAEDDGFDIEKELKKIGKPKTKLGDVINLGPHKLICGDSTDPAVLKKLLGQEKSSMIYSDPVYNLKGGVDYAKGVGGKASYGGSVNDTRTDDEYKIFLRKSMEAALAVAKEDVHVFYWCDESYIWLVQTLYRELGLVNKRVNLWIKNSQNPTPGVAFNKCFEPAVYAVRGKPYLAKGIDNLNEIFNKDIGTGNRLIDDILDLLNIWLVKRLAGNEYQHATSKPPTLHERAIRRCSKPGDIILDSFGGSGSALIAAHQLKRRAYLVELEPRFCDLIIARYKKLTNENHEEK